MNLFDSSSYFEVLTDRIEQNSDTKGYKAIVAKAARCQPSFLSNVLGKRANLNDDQAAALAEFWGFSEREANYFICLVHYERAGSDRLKKRYQRELERLRSEHLSYIRLRAFGSPQGKDLSIDGHVFYFSNWYISAIHYSTLLPHIDSVESIAKHFCLEVKLVEETVQQLVKLGLVENRDGTIAFSQSPTFDKWNPSLARVLHDAMRTRANHKYGNRSELDYFHTSWFTLSHQELQYLRKEIDKFIENLDENLSSPSPSDKLVGFCMDFFEI